MVTRPGHLSPGVKVLDTPLDKKMSWYSELIASYRGGGKKTSSVYDCTVEDVEYICNSNSTLCLFYFAIFVVLLLS